MSHGFTKLFSSILQSTIWCEPTSTRIVWITMLAACDREGCINASVPGLANLAGVSIDEVHAALQRFMEPDKYSRTKDHDGRRIEEVDGGWRLLNYEKYRELGNPIRATLDMEGYVYYAGVPGGDRVKIGFSKNPWARINDLRVSVPSLEILATERATMAREKERHAEFAEVRIEGEWFRFTPTVASLVSALATRDLRSKAGSSHVGQRTTKGTTVAAEAEAEAEEDTSKARGFERFWAVWPAGERKGAKGECLTRWKRFGCEEKVETILAHVEAMKTSRDWREGYVPAPLVYLNKRRWEGASTKPAARKVVV